MRGERGAGCDNLSHTHNKHPQMSKSIGRKSLNGRISVFNFLQGFSSCCRAILLTPMEHDRSPPPRCASPLIGSAGDAVLRRGEAEGTPRPSLRRDRPPLSRHGQEGKRHPSAPDGLAPPA